MRHTLPAGIVGPGFNDEFGDTYGIIYGFTADGFTHRELRDKVEDIRSRLLLVPDVSKIEILGAQDERIFVEVSMQVIAGLGLDRGALIEALQAQNIVRPAGVLQTGDEALSLRARGRSDPSGMSAPSTSSPAVACSGSATSPRSGATMRTRRSRCSVSTASRRSGSPSPCATAATSWRSAGTSRRRWRRSPPIYRATSNRFWEPIKP